jgi:2-polyprenyl-3-methyl-5-hydroxy-6-metoxy-1,4-benzoquinol methylase
MDAGAGGEELDARRREVVARWGPWQHHNIYLGNGVYTMGDDASGGQQVRLPQLVQLATDLLSLPLEEARVLDLAAHEGLFATEFARRGSTVVAVEIREEHVEKAKFARDVLGLTGMAVRRDDVRNVTPDGYGQFDLVLCLGILYHMNAGAAFDLVNTIGQLCRGVAIVDTVISLQPRESFEHHGFTYWGRSVWEHDPTSTPAERVQVHGASFDNRESFWLTKPSLLNLLRRSGFTSVLEARVPRPQHGARDRTLLAAVRGAPQHRMLSAPLSNAAGDPDWPERERLRVRPSQARLGRAKYLLARALPASARRAYRNWRDARR